MSKGKLAKFADMEAFENVFQYPYSVVDDVPFEMKGKWREMYFHNDNPIVLELGCGKGEYTVELAKLYPGMNFIGVDIKGARMWTGAKKAIEEGQKNVAFLRTNIEIIDRFFVQDEVQENHLPVLFRTEDLYHHEGIDDVTRKILSIQTYYESMWIERGLNIKYMKFELPRQGELVEPDKEIPLDDYRSYRRDKRTPKETGK